MGCPVGRWWDSLLTLVAVWTPPPSHPVRPCTSWVSTRASPWPIPLGADPPPHRNEPPTCHRITLGFSSGCSWVPPPRAISTLLLPKPCWPSRAQSIPMPDVAWGCPWCIEPPLWCLPHPKAWALPPLCLLPHQWQHLALPRLHPLPREVFCQNWPPPQSPWGSRPLPPPLSLPGAFPWALWSLWDCFRGFPTMGTPSGITSDHRHRPLPHPMMGVLPITAASFSCCFAGWNWAIPHPKNVLSILRSLTKLLWWPFLGNPLFYREVSSTQFLTVADWLTSKSCPLCHDKVLGQWSVSHLTSTHYPFELAQAIYWKTMGTSSVYKTFFGFSRNFHFGSIWWSWEGPRFLFGWNCPCSLHHGLCFGSFGGLHGCYHGCLHSLWPFLFWHLGCHTCLCWLWHWQLPAFCGSPLQPTAGGSDSQPLLQ